MVKWKFYFVSLNLTKEEKIELQSMIGLVNSKFGFKYEKIKVEI